MNFKAIFTSVFLASVCLFTVSFSSVEARHHCRSGFSVNIGAVTPPQTYVVQHHRPCNRVYVQPNPCRPVVVYQAYPAPCYEEVVVVPSRPVIQTGFSFGWFFR
jgi:hypothetical protein